MSEARTSLSGPTMTHSHCWPEAQVIDPGDMVAQTQTSMGNIAIAG